MSAKSSELDNLKQMLEQLRLKGAKKNVLSTPDIALGIWLTSQIKTLLEQR